MKLGDLNLVGVVFLVEKKSMVNKVKDLFGGVKKDYYYLFYLSVGFGVGVMFEFSFYGIIFGDGFMGYFLDFIGLLVGNDFGKDEGYKKVSLGVLGFWLYFINFWGEMNVYGGVIFIDN